MVEQAQSRWGEEPEASLGGDINDIKTENLTLDEVAENFKHLELKPELLSGIYDYGLKRPSVLQECVIPSIINGRNLTARVQAGVERTTAFVIPVLQKLDLSVHSNQAVIVTLNRQRAEDVQNLVTALGKQLDNLDSVAFTTPIVSKSLRDTMMKVKEGSHLVIGTPGRIYELIRRGMLNMESVKIICIDEMDDMLSKDFGVQLYGITERLPADREIQFFVLSPTFPIEVSEFIDKHLKDPIQVVIPRKETRGSDEWGD